MLKYTFFGIIAGLVLIAAGFYVLARWNDRDAEAGPTPVYVVRVDREAAVPATIEVGAGRLVELRIENRALLLRSATIEGPGVEQLPAETTGPGSHSTSQPLPGFNLLVGSQDDGSALVRFREAGEFELRIENPGRPETLRIVQITAR